MRVGFKWDRQRRRDGASAGELRRVEIGPEGGYRPAVMRDAADAAVTKGLALQRRAAAGPFEHRQPLALHDVAELGAYLAEGAAVAAPEAFRRLGATGLVLDQRVRDFGAVGEQCDDRPALPFLLQPAQGCDEAIGKGIHVGLRGYLGGG